MCGTSVNTRCRCRFMDEKDNKDDGEKADSQYPERDCNLTGYHGRKGDRKMIYLDNRGNHLP